MDSSAQASTKSLTPPPQGGSIPRPPKCVSEGSLSPSTLSAKSPHDDKIGFPFPSRPTRAPSVEWGGGEAALSRRGSRLHIELAGCVETKTVTTTTTTTKRSYPPLHFRQRSLASLDSKQYPLAVTATPPELADLTSKYDGQFTDVYEDDHHPLEREVLTSRSQKPPFSNRVSDRTNLVTGEQAYRTPGIDKGPSPLGERADKNRDISNGRKTTRRFPELAVKSPGTFSSKPRRTKLLSGPQMGDEDNHCRQDDCTQHHGLSINSSDNTSFPATPDPSEIEHNDPHQSSSFGQTTFTPQSRLSETGSVGETQSTSDTTDQDVFTGAVATPPVAESDLEPLEGPNAALTPASGQRPIVNTAVTQGASLPSPGLSPTYQVEFEDSATHEGDHNNVSPSSQYDNRQYSTASGSKPTASRLRPRPRPKSLQYSQRQLQELTALTPTIAPTLVDPSTMIETFDAMPDELKSYMMYQLLRRCHKKTLHTIANIVNPALRCDYLDELPLELSLHILSFLDLKDLCRASQVSKKWRGVIDSNETGWKELFDRDGLHLPAGELERAIKQGWGWQDPYGLDGFEQDLSVSKTYSEGDHISHRPENEVVRKFRSSTKRKRTSGSTSLERAKRNPEKTHATPARGFPSAKFKSDGPLTAASLAAQAVPDPGVGLPSLRKLHLFKSLYRRHYMLGRSWDGKTEPHHFAFAAHPTHVITCLQFDDDKILTGSDDAMIHVYDTRTGLLRRKLAGHEGGVWALQYEGNVLVSGSTDRSVRVWDIEMGLCTQVFYGHISTVRCLQILLPEPTGRVENGRAIMLPEKPLIITGSRDSHLRVWRLPEQGSKRYIQNGTLANDADCPYFVRVLTGHSHSVRAIDAHQDTIVSGSYDFTVRVWKISTGETVHRLQGHSTKVYSVVLDHKRNRCISGSMDTYVKIWSLETGACLFTLEGHTSLVGLLGLRDERLVSAAADSTLRIWNPENGHCKSTLTAHTGAITCFQHDGQKVVSGSDRTLKMWDIKTGEHIKDLLTDLTGVWQVKFDGRRCVAAVQREGFTYVEVLDFGASRDGIPASRRGFREVIEESEPGETDALLRARRGN